ncbi:MAG TPA: TRAP transporter small permease subunit [Opitutaceae bacterium]
MTENLVADTDALMSPGAAVAVKSGGRRVGWLRRLHQGENLLLVAVLIAMVLLPVSEVLRRMGVPVRIQGAEEFLRHLTLLAGMLGGAIAARENRLLSLSSLPQFLPGRGKRAAAFFSGVIAAATTIVLCGAAVQFIIGEREVGGSLAYDIPRWWVQAVFPRREWRVAAAAPRVHGLVWPYTRRPGHRYGAGVRLLYDVHGRVWCHHSGARRTTHADARGDEVLRAERARPAHGRGLARHSASAGAPAHIVWPSS